MLTPEQIRQAEDAAEEIIAAAEVGMFHGSHGEYANALLTLAARDVREAAAKVHPNSLREWLDQDTATIGDYERRERTEQDQIDSAREAGRY